MIGRVFGRLTVIYLAVPYISPRGQVFRKWECQCECGNTLTTRESSLTGGYTTSCGCFQKELAGISAKDRYTKHGLSGHRVYRIYRDMLRRCYSPKHASYENYHSKGITVCDRWAVRDGFVNFVEDMGIPEIRDSIERINPFGNYCPENCKWEPSMSEQGFNKGKRSSNTSGKTGVRWNQNGQKWQAYIMKDNKFYSYGLHSNFERAVAARRQAELDMYGHYQQDYYEAMRQGAV